MLSMILFGLLVAALLVVTGAIVWSIRQNMREGESYYDDLAERLQGLRLFQALKMFGTDPIRYVFTEPVVNLEKYMRLCNACQERGRCDACLAGGDCLHRFQFCPNYHTLARLRQRA